MSKKKIFIFLIIGIVVIVVLIKNIFFDNENKYNINYENILTTATSDKKELEDDLIKIHIEGEVNNPGLIELLSGDRILDAIEKAGGTTDLADLSKVNLAYVLSDGEKIYIPSLNDDGNAEYILSNTGENLKININTATQEQLQTLDGVGESIALSIISYREKNGKFTSIEEIKNVSGIGDSKFEKIKDDISVK